MSELRRCPFCGVEVKTYDEPVDANTISHQFSCNNCGMVAYFDYLDEEESIEAWNRREPIDKIIAKLESGFMAEENRFRMGVYLDVIEMLEGGLE